jgi:hypothetical protein
MKIIERLLLGIAFLSFGTGASAQFVISPAMSGSWYDPAQSGQGFNFEVISATQLVAYFYTFDPEGNNIFLSGVGTIGGASAVVPLSSVTGGFFPPKLDPSKIVRTDWGTLTVSFSDCSSGTATWVPSVGAGQGYTSATVPITRITSIDGLVCGVGF